MADADIDLYADDIDHDFSQENDYNHDANVDLYDDVITAPSDEIHNNEGRPSSAGSSPPHHSKHTGKRYAVYVGNLTWWTTDQDLTEAMQSLGVNDITEVKFYENRANGQSKGFCVVALRSEKSLCIVMEKLPKKELHGQNPAVTACTRQNLNYFELQSRKGGHGGGNRHENSNERRSRDRDRERDRDSRDMRSENRSMQQERTRSRNTTPQNYQQQQRIPPGNHMQPPPQGPPPPQYQPGRTPWISAPPPQIHHMPPPPTRPSAPQINTGAPPPPPGLQAPPPVRPGPPPPNNMRLPPPRGPMPPVGPRSVPPPDTRGPPPTNDWERHLSQPPPQHVNIPPQPVGPPNRPPPPVPAPGQGMPPSIPPPSVPIPSPHINPAFFHQQGVPPGLAPTSQGGDLYSRPPPVQFSDYRSVGDRGTESSAPAVSDAEFEEIMGRNRTVSSSAIARAVADASAADYASAIETLVTAISLIKQSKVANDERCKILISSLQDTLHGIESKSYGSRSKERARSRERERSRERSSRREKSSRRDRSRSRDREYRDRSRERDRYHDDRYRDKDRDHDRDRRSSRH
ncbi:cleavage and polyadenylation specificity factor subunit 6 [Caerostris extrusa]|uniref:Cleavage and polyadenylation specificity factor subunit 6 n=1 Tax=Caerostris extrusa TaxID=172846 RepID=A0AAV4NIM3_CAEEX|nr:cleavage and polyadenylation specificity factor subunit 6 [Caerostris extrusa]